MTRPSAPCCARTRSRPATIASSASSAVSERAMPSFRTGEVVRVLEERPGLQRVEVDLGCGPERAYVLPQLTGTVALGDRVVVNTTAVELGLGTGGWHVVHWNLARESFHEPGPGHILKGRYKSLQTDAATNNYNLTLLDALPT